VDFRSRIWDEWVWTCVSRKKAGDDELGWGRPSRSVQCVCVCACPYICYRCQFDFQLHDSSVKTLITRTVSHQNHPSLNPSCLEPSFSSSRFAVSLWHTWIDCLNIPVVNEPALMYFSFLWEQNTEKSESSHTHTSSLCGGDRMHERTHARICCSVCVSVCVVAQKVKNIILLQLYLAVGGTY